MAIYSGPVTDAQQRKVSAAEAAQLKLKVKAARDTRVHKLAREGMRLTSIADATGLSPSTVSAILRGRP